MFNVQTPHVTGTYSSNYYTSIRNKLTVSPYTTLTTSFPIPPLP